MSQTDQIELQDQERAGKVQLVADQEANDLHWLMGSKRGRRIVWRLLERSGVFRQSFNTNAMLMAFAEGNRNLGNQYLALVMARPDKFTLMLEESNNE